MGGELETPNLEKKSIEGKNNTFRYGLNIIQGWKKTLDVYNIYNTINTDKDKNLYIFGIFDGHSGNEISQYLSENFCNELTKNKNFNSKNYKKALKETFIAIDNSLRKEEINNILKRYSQKNEDKLKLFYEDKNNNLNEDDLYNINIFMNLLEPNNLEQVLISDYIGSSGLIILIDENITYIANAGNSNFIIINKEFKINNKIIEEQIQQETNEKKRRRISKGIKYGKEIKSEKYEYTRGFGNFQFKNNNLINKESQEILSEPFIYEINNKDIMYIIAFNNGFYEHFKCFNNSTEDINRNYKKISDDFIACLKDSNKPINEQISSYIDNLIKNNRSSTNNDNNKKFKIISQNLSCGIIEFFS